MLRMVAACTGQNRVRQVQAEQREAGVRRRNLKDVPFIITSHSLLQLHFHFASPGILPFLDKRTLAALRA